MRRLFELEKSKIYLILTVIVIIAVVLFIQFGRRSININNSSIASEEPTELVNNGKVSPITGETCQNYDRRPVGVMLAMDPVTRPLSGISMADLVVEMPVITDSITRLMAVFGCQEPREIGSVRSSRHDYIPLAMGLDAIFGHWGGSHFALDKLNAGIMDNIDAMKNPYNAYWQKSDKPMPHNGFTSISRLFNSAEKLGYRLTNKFEGYPHQEFSIPNSQFPKNSKGSLDIGYPGNYKVYYQYNPKTNSYLRWRAGTPEIDALNNKQVEVQNVVVMKAASRMIQVPDYNDVDVEGTGEAIVFRNGEEIRGTWQKKGTDQPTKLYFLNEKGEEIKFAPGQIWIEIMEPHQPVKWQIIKT